MPTENENLSVRLIGCIVWHLYSGRDCLVWAWPAMTALRSMSNVHVRMQGYTRIGIEKRRFFSVIFVIFVLLSSRSSAAHW